MEPDSLSFLTLIIKLQSFGGHLAFCKIPPTTLSYIKTIGLHCMQDSHSRKSSINYHPPPPKGYLPSFKNIKIVVK